MVSQSRKHRGYRSQRIVADWFRDHGWPFAESTGAGRPGVDVTGVPGLLVEVKARREFTPLAWLRQAASEARTGGLPLVVFRCNGQGEANVGEWGALLRLDVLTQLLAEAGYGDGSLQERAEPDRSDAADQHGGESKEPDAADDESGPVVKGRTS